jgi:hypothetical protein
MSDYLRPKVKTGNLNTRTMEDGIFRNPPLYTNLGGFSSAAKFEGVNKKKIGNPSLERGGPSAQKGKPI